METGHKTFLTHYGGFYISNIYVSILEVKLQIGTNNLDVETFDFAFALK